MPVRNLAVTVSILSTVVNGGMWTLQLEVARCEAGSEDLLLGDLRQIASPL